MKELQFLIYRAENDQEKASVIVSDETIWTSQKEMARLFDVGVPAISKHLKNIFEEGELDEHLVISKMETTASDGKNYLTSYYNLDAIISVGYRVNSQKATKFRQWATTVLREYMIKGFAMDDERLKQGENLLEKDYFRELLERVRSIRASERRIWLQITDIFAEIAIDYDVNSLVTKQFYAHVQNKFHYAITGKTAAEIIYEKADHTKVNMGLVTWKHSPDGRILQSDALVAKNYLNEKEIRSLERSISGYFDYLERQIEQGKTQTMQDLADSIDRFLAFQDYELLEGHGQITRQVAKEKARSEYAIFNKTQKINSDFEKLLEDLSSK
ncbi:cell filamentation protein Fic [Streptococcus suis]|uniref:Cell filamentation protein Fic n=1 Tax=Streptococcus suis TaxID=1307 RepID=A0A4V4RWE2_STRSU|nr:virulence RhuM family protein [Streptococcus suis]MBY4967116.1 virulence RhuM family protein [Streptococcus suis]MBY5021348.1 virulence RhuM family protein [Streptococcus suis]TIH99524.1 cell filamentation protein Fic [Streptococcus suis]HEL1661602.1 virulence RhuM family protein [Streptococcus suis]HEL9644713.1 virulence RhuM family protein [Streptococcus suis]